MLARFVSMFFVAVVALGVPTPGPDAWTPLRNLLDGWLFTENYGVTIGNASHGRVFEYLGGNMTLHTHVQTASTSKWPLAMMFAGLVQDGTIKSLDDPLSDYFDWWTTDKNDNRSYVTLNHLLSFTSGFGGGAPGLKHGPRSHHLSKLEDAACVYNEKGDISECTKIIYETVKMAGRPGTVWAYNSNHLQVAGGLAVHVTGLTIQEVIDKYLFKAYGMVETTCGDGAPNPPLAVCLNTTGSDYEKFLAAQVGFKVLSQEIVKRSESDHTTFLDGYQLYGHYGFGHFLECFDSPDGFTPACAKANTHIDPGAYGYYPLLDRANGYYLNLIAYEDGEFYPRSGIPEYLGVAIKPFVDAIMRGEDISNTAGHHVPEFLSLSPAGVNYCMDCYVYPKHCA